VLEVGLEALFTNLTPLIPLSLARREGNGIKRGALAPLKRPWGHFRGVIIPRLSPSAGESKRGFASLILPMEGLLLPLIREGGQGDGLPNTLTLALRLLSP
jgi:hypothetical protein